MSWIRRAVDRAEADEEARRSVEDALRDAVGLVPYRDGPATLGGDERRLRGIPAIGRGVSGEIPGTHPEKTILRRRDNYTNE